MATLQLPGLESALEPLEPFRGACPTCGRRVLALEVDGCEVVVEVAEVLEAFRCPLCAKVAGMGHARSECPRCALSGWIGERLPPLRIDGEPTGVLLDAEGRARWFHGVRREAEAVHMFHTCA